MQKKYVILSAFSVKLCVTKMFFNYTKKKEKAQRTTEKNIFLETESLALKCIVSTNE